jgi:Domain of unknown function (DUF1854)
MIREPQPIRLIRDEFGRLAFFGPDGVRHERVMAVRAFPISAPNLGVAICNSEGCEVYWIDDLATLPAATREQVEDELATSQFLPTILQISRVSSDSTPCEFEVITDRGPTRFTLDSDEQIRPIGLDRFIITDARGVRYQVPDLSKLDAASRRGLERHL